MALIESKVFGSSCIGILKKFSLNVRKINYFECFDGSAIRSLEGSLSGAIQGLKISNDGKYLVTGGQDRLLKVRLTAQHL